MRKPPELMKTLGDEKNGVTGFVCKCGKEHHYPGYVHAHWNEVLIFECDCRRKFNILVGVSTLTYEPKVKAQDA